MEKGEAPSEEIEREWFRMMQTDERMRQEKLNRQAVVIVFLNRKIVIEI
jgi:hypothetical protein